MRILTVAMTAILAAPILAHDGPDLLGLCSTYVAADRQKEREIDRAKATRDAKIGKNYGFGGSGSRACRKTPDYMDVFVGTSKEIRNALSKEIEAYDDATSTVKTERERILLDYFADIHESKKGYIDALADVMGYLSIVSEADNPTLHRALIAHDAARMASSLLSMERNHYLISIEKNFVVEMENAAENLRNLANHPTKLAEQSRIDLFSARYVIQKKVISTHKDDLDRHWRATEQQRTLMDLMISDVGSGKVERKVWDAPSASDQARRAHYQRISENYRARSEQSGIMRAYKKAEVEYRLSSMGGNDLIAAKRKVTEAQGAAMEELRTIIHEAVHEAKNEYYEYDGYLIDRAIEAWNDYIDTEDYARSKYHRTVRKASNPVVEATGRYQTACEALYDSKENETEAEFQDAVVVAQAAFLRRMGSLPPGTTDDNTLAAIQRICD